MSSFHPQEDDNLNIVHLETQIRLQGRTLGTCWKGEKKDVPAFLLVEDLDMAASASQLYIIE